MIKILRKSKNTLGNAICNGLCTFFQEVVMEHISVLQCSMSA